MGAREGGGREVSHWTAVDTLITAVVGAVAGWVLWWVLCQLL